MEKKKNLQKRVVDIPATSKLLKKQRIDHGYSVIELRELLQLESRVAIYAWENEKLKNIPSLENLDALARLYDVNIEELYVMIPVNSEECVIKDYSLEYEIDIDCILSELDEDEKKEFLFLMGKQ